MQNIRFDHLTIRDGLANSKVRGITQDKEGFMWFSTQDGLNKYDGYNFTTYKNVHNDSTSLSHNGLRRNNVDREGNIWITTWGGGLNKFDRKLERFVQYRNKKNDSNSISDDFVYCVFEDIEGKIWIGTDKGGVDVLDVQTNTMTHYKFDKNDPTSIGDNQIRDFYEDSAHNLWIGTGGGGLNLFDRKTKTFKKFKHDPANPKSIGSNSIRAIIQDRKGRYWIGTYGDGLDLFDPVKEEFTHFRHDPKNSNSLTHNYVQVMCEDSDGNLWVGTENGGFSIFNFDANVFVNYVHDDIDRGSLSDNSIYAIFKDYRGNMWVGTYNDGVNYINRRAKFAHYRHTSSPTSISSNLVVGMHEDKKGNLWIGTDGGGLNLFDRKKGTFTHFKHQAGNPNSICGDHVLTLTSDSYGNIWIGTWAAGVTMFNPETNVYKHFRHDPADSTSLSVDNIWAVFEDSEKNMWIGTYGGGLEMYNRDKGNFTHFKSDPDDPESISVNLLYKIIEDRSGYLWIGTDGGGVNRFDKKTKKFKRFMHDPTRNSLSHNRIVSIHEDRKGNLWIGSGQGLNHFNIQNEQFTVYGIEDGFISESILGILEDKQGNIWVSTNGGVSRLNPATRKVENFTSDDGLQSGDQSQGYCKSRTGAMYFGGKSGFNEFFPEKIVQENFNPPLVFTDFEIFNKTILPDPRPGSTLSRPISQTKKVALSYRQSVFSIQFASLNYANPSRRKYSYMLEGFDKDWNIPTMAHSATYTNLDPGEYIFKVKGLDSDGNWSAKMAELTITIAPPFWKTWWFKALAVFSVGGIVLGWYGYRFTMIKRQKQELEKQVKERTSELEELYNETKDSIRAAQVIQNSILPTEKIVKEYLPESFILNKPKDVVSGDFYWLGAKGNKLIIAAADCTGHGVPGAFMSINGYHLLNQAIYSNAELSAARILNQLNEDIIHDVDRIESQTGMDIALCIVDFANMTIQYSGAMSPLYILRNGELIQIKADRFAIGLAFRGQIKKFSEQEIPIQKGDVIYMFSDGYVDQIGGTNFEKYNYKRFRSLLIQNGHHPMEQQLQILDNAITQWQGQHAQLDDILVMGFKIV